MTKYIVTALGPIDMHEPGADVTGVYRGAVLARLIDEGYIAEDKPKRKSVKPADALAGEVDAVADDGSEDGE